MLLIAVVVAVVVRFIADCRCCNCKRSNLQPRSQFTLTAIFTTRLSTIISDIVVAVVVVVVAVVIAVVIVGEMAINNSNNSSKNNNNS